MKKIVMVINDCWKCPYHIYISNSLDKYSNEGFDMCSILGIQVLGSIPNDCPLEDVE